MSTGPYGLTLGHGVGSLAAGSAKFGATGRASGAYSFLRGALYGLIPAKANQSVLGSGTIEAWVRLPSNPAATKVAVGGQNIAYIGCDASGNAIAQVGSGVTVSTSVSLANNVWHHVALVIDGSGRPRLYVDGVLAGSSTTSATAGTSGTPISGVTPFIGAFNATATFDWPGDVDEVRISQIERYRGASFAVPAAPFASDADTLALWHLEDLTDSGPGIIPATIPAISVASAGGNDTITYPAPVAGDNAVAGVKLYRGTATGAEAGVELATNASAAASAFVTPSPTPGQSFFYYVRPYDSAGILGPPSNEVVSTNASINILANDAGINYSPGNWDVNASRALSINPGATVRTLIAGGATAVSLAFDVAGLVGATPQIAYRVDQGGWTVAPIAASVQLALPANGWAKHTVEFVVKATAIDGERWTNPNTFVKFLGFVTTPNTCTASAPQKRKLKGLCYGDSITEGTRTLSGAGTTATDPNRSDSTQGWAWRLSETLGAEIGVIGFGSTGLTQAGVGNVPAMTASYNKITSAITRTFDADIDFVVINQGVNDANKGTTNAAFTTALTSVLNSLLAALPAQAIVFVMLPFNVPYPVSVYQAGIAACSNPRRVVFIDTTGWFSSTDSSDGLHPYGYINIAKLSPLTAAAIRTGLNRGAQYRKQGDGSLKQISTRRV